MEIKDRHWRVVFSSLDDSQKNISVPWFNKEDLLENFFLNEIISNTYIVKRFMEIIEKEKDELKNCKVKGGLLFSRDMLISDMISMIIGSLRDMSKGKYIVSKFCEPERSIEAV